MVFVASVDVIVAVCCAVIPDLDLSSFFLHIVQKPRAALAAEAGKTLTCTKTHYLREAQKGPPILYCHAPSAR